MRADPLTNLKAGFKSLLIANFKTPLYSKKMKANFESQL